MGATKYRAVYRDGKLLAEYESDKLVYLSPEYSAPKRSELSGPMIMRDIGEYRSPLDGSMVTSRSQHRDHMRAHDVVEVGNERIGTLTPTETPRSRRDLIGEIKHHVEQVTAMPQAAYDEHVQTQQAEHAEVAALVTA